MTTSSYLDKFRSGLRQVQSQQILKLISKEKDAGSITTVEEFRSRLEELTAHLQAQTIQPTLQLFLGEVSELIDSESFNFMLERIQDDLTASYSELNDIDEILSAHENIINNVVLQNLELAINDLEAKIESFEFVNKNKDGLDNAIFNTFRATQNNRTAQEKQVLFLDPKSGVLSNDPSFKATLDVIGEKLLLNTEIEDLVPLASARQIFDFESIASELNVEFSDSDINNIVDNRSGTFWVQSTLLSKPKDELGVITKIEIDLGGVQSVNSLEIEPLVLYPVEITNISIIDPNNQSVTILSEAVEAKSNNKFFFNTLSAKKVIIKVRNRNFSTVQFTTKPDSPVPEIVRDPGSINQSIENISEELDDLISSPLLAEAIGAQTFISEDKSYYEYLVGFDNIKLGLSTFNDTAIFVSKSEKINSLGQLAVKVNEKRPIGDIDSSSVEYTTDTNPASTSDYFHGSFEYYVIKRDFSAADSLLNSTVFPVLPLGTTQIRHETLSLTETSDTGFLQFFTLDDPYHSVDNPTGDIIVYRNGEILENADATTGVTAALEIDGWTKDTTLTQDTPGQPLRMSYAIKIQQPNVNNIYTVSYTPTVSTTNVIPTEPSPAAVLSTAGLKLVDLTGDLRVWLGKDNIVYFKKVELGIEVAYSTANLVVVLRRNSANTNLSPVLEDYLLATGTRDTLKFGN